MLLTQNSLERKTLNIQNIVFVKKCMTSISSAILQLWKETRFCKRGDYVMIMLPKRRHVSQHKEHLRKG